MSEGGPKDRRPRSKMEGETIDRIIHISSIDRMKSRPSRPEDFQIRFTPELRLPEDMVHKIGLSRLNMTYSWHNITEAYGNNKIKYSKDGGSTWEDIVFTPGNYSYDDLNKYVEEVIGKGNTDGISFSFVLSAYKILVKLAPNWQLDFRNSEFGDLIGFEKKIVSATEMGSRLPNITNSVDALYLECDICESIVNGISSNTLDVIPTDGLRRSFPFRHRHPYLIFMPVTTNKIQKIHFSLKDAVNRLVDLNGVDLHLSLVLRSTPRARWSDV